MEIAIVTDEISDDPQTSMELGMVWGVRVYELRGCGTERVPLFTPFQKRRIEELLDHCQVRIAAISPGLFKCANPLALHEHFPLNIIDQSLYEKWRGPRDVVAYHLPAILPMTADREADFDAYGRYLE